MGTRKLFMLNTHFDFLDKAYVKEFVYDTMFRVIDSFWVFVCKLFLFVFGSIIGYIFRFLPDKDFQRNESKSIVVVSHYENDNGSCTSDYGDLKLDEFSMNQTGFQCRSSDCVDISNGERENFVLLETVLMASTSKYEFLSGKNISGFMEVPKKFSLIVHELYLGSDDHAISNSGFLDSGVSVDGDICEPKLELEFVVEEKAEDSVENFIIEKTPEKQEQVRAPAVVEEDPIESFVVERILEKEDHEMLTEHDSSVQGEMMISRRISHSLESFTFELMANEDVEEELVPENLVVIDGEDAENIEEIRLRDARILEPEEVVMSDESNDSDDEFIELEPFLENSSVVEEEMLTIEDSREVEDKNEVEDLIQKQIIESIDCLEEYEEPSSQEEQSISNFEEEDDWEFEHDDVIEQLKMELKNARTGGLPTIFEESESLKIVEELKPLKIDEKIEHKDRMIEIQKVYGSYLGKMRKLDILNSQIMHAISLVKLKDSATSNSTEKSSDPAVKSLLLLNLWPFRQRRPEADPIQKMIGDLHKDFETVYIGQVCLSWEILHWQYGKSLELLQYDFQALLRYNQVAGDFQLFQVLMQRFIENEPYEGRPRIENYVKNRCASNNFLQVPVIRDDRLKDNKGRVGEEENAITSANLREIIWESMCVFQEFLRADKYEVNSILKGPHQTQVAPQDPIDLELLMDIRTDLLKKEKRLKDISRSGNCIVKKKLQKDQGNQLNRAVFITQVELKLISRVLNMSKLTTDQLVWCYEKLHKINFSSRKIHLEPSCSFFPC